MLSQKFAEIFVPLIWLPHATLSSVSRGERVAIGVMVGKAGTPSFGDFRADGVETHQALLKAGIWIIEGLNLKRVRPGRVQLVCLPLKVLKGDGALAKALGRPMDHFGREKR